MSEVDVTVSQTDELPAPLVGVRHRGRRWQWQLVATVAAVLLAIAAPVVIIHRHRSASGPVLLPGFSVPTAVTVSASGPAGAAALAHGRWTPLPVAPIAGRDDAATAWTGTQMLVWGGSSSDGEHSYADGAAYDPLAHQWQVLPAGPLSARSSAASVWTGSQLFVWGGDLASDAQQQKAADDGALYDPSTRTWRSIAASPLSSRVDATALWTGSEVVVIGGTPAVQTNSQRTLVDAAAYDPGTNTWHRLPAVPSRSGRVTDGLTAVATPGGIYAWLLWEHDVSTPDGGSVSSGVDLSRFYPGTGRWTGVAVAPPNVTGNPLWTGSDVIMPAAQPFYGDVPGPYVPYLNGWRMDLSTDAWHKLPRGPVDAFGASSIWTGAALLSFNSESMSTGPHSNTYPGQAAAWDPATGRWTRLAAAPFAGADISVVWTGSQLIEWGLMSPSRKVNGSPTSSGLSFGP
jgi:hypothetical protein